MASLDRREFLRRSAAAGVALSLPALAGAAAAEPPRVRRRVVLGRTGLSVPDIGFGIEPALDGDEALVRHALERGIDYFDTAESYTGGASEETLGRALRGVREQVTIASKVSCGDGRPRRRSVPRARRQPAPPADRPHRHLLQPRRERRRAAARTRSGPSSPRARRSRARSASPACPGHGGRLARVPRLRASTTTSSTSCWSPTTSARTRRSTSASPHRSTSSPCSPSCRACSRRRSRRTSAWSR